MPALSSKTKSLFIRYGRRGGLKRATSLSKIDRSMIAKNAAKARWNKSLHSSPQLMPSIRLNQSNLADPTFLEELLQEGSLKDWKSLYEEIADKPFGPVSEALERVLFSTKIYGVTPLWKGILKVVRGGDL